MKKQNQRENDLPKDSLLLRDRCRLRVISFDSSRIQRIFLSSILLVGVRDWTNFL